MATPTRTPLFARRQHGGVFDIVSIDRHPAGVWFVNSVTGTDSVGYGKNPDAPFATLAYALATGGVAANDTVYLLPNHAEALAGAAGIACATVGVTIIGLGNGASRPTFTWSAVASTWTVTAADVTLKNVRCTATAAATKMFSVTAAGATFDAVDYVEGSGLPLQFLLTSAAADQLSIRNCCHVAITAGASAQVWIEIVGTDDALIEDNRLVLALNNAAGSFAIRASTAAVRATIRRNVVVQTGGTTQVSAISLVATSTGYVADNRVAANVTTLAGTVALASAYGSNNYTSHTANKSGILDPVADA